VFEFTHGYHITTLYKVVYMIIMVILFTGITKTCCDAGQIQTLDFNMRIPRQVTEYFSVFKFN
jgi:hypothetical protein